ncbi:MAG: glutathione S-transferase family protein [Gammaproteobacteria bacterium]|nr:glutathione S-transferase family protein [Gammaproteobacteria bacterium]MDH5177106.1 glutathione S-transferase family protein [Gammaproteobacteria bacterium]
MYQLCSHPFSSYSQKVLIALYENATPFEYRNLEDPTAKAELARLSPLGRFPVLVDDGRAILESTTIIEYLQLHAPGPVQLIPDGAAGIEARMLDRIYPWLDARLRDRTWAAGDDFTLADCAAAPSLFHADWAHPIPAQFAGLSAYRARLLARPSFARAVEEARPYRAYFPLGAPDRD